MKALSVRSPWWAILHLGKDIENRDWYTNLRGTVYLRAGKFWDDEEIDGDIEDISSILVGQRPDILCPKDLIRAGCGSIVGTVTSSGAYSKAKANGFWANTDSSSQIPLPFSSRFHSSAPLVSSMSRTLWSILPLAELSN